MSKQSNITDEQIVAALLGNTTQEAAANALGITPRTLYNRMSERSFQAIYAEAKIDLIREATLNINEQLAAAVNVIVDVMNDKEANPSIRLQAAQTILNNASKFAERLQGAEWQASEKLRNLKSPFCL